MQIGVPAIPYLSKSNSDKKPPIARPNTSPTTIPARQLP